MSIGSILNQVRSGMNAQQIAMQTASQNISNAKTVGYSRETVNLTAAQPSVFSYGSVGTGVRVASITRARDALLDTTFRSDSAASSAADTTNQALTQVQSILNEPSDNGLSASLDAFWSSWGNLANDPTNGPAKSVVREAGADVASTLNRFASQLDSLDHDNRVSLAADVAQVNSLSTQIAALNKQIVAAESNGTTANDLRDQRDNLLDQTAKLIGGQTVDRANGSTAVYVGGRVLVDGTAVYSLQMNNGQPPTVSFSGSTAAIDGAGGSIGAEISISATTIPTVMQSLDSLASGIVQTVNGIHAAGTVYTGTPPVGAPAGNFFDVTNPAPTGVDPLLTARGIRIVPSLTAADVTASGGTATGPGNNDVATALAALNTTAVTLNLPGAQTTTASFGDFYNQTVADVATATRQAQDDSTVQTTLTSNADTQRQSVSGVSTDEELINVIQHQQAYQAAARLVSVVNDMAQTLIDLGR